MDNKRHKSMKIWTPQTLPTVQYYVHEYNTHTDLLAQVVLKWKEYKINIKSCTHLITTDAQI